MLTYLLKKSAFSLTSLFIKIFLEPSKDVNIASSFKQASRNHVATDLRIKWRVTFVIYFKIPQCSLIQLKKIDQQKIGY